MFPQIILLPLRLLQDGCTITIIHLNLLLRCCTFQTNSSWNTWSDCFSSSKSTPPTHSIFDQLHLGILKDPTNIITYKNEKNYFLESKLVEYPDSASWSSNIHQLGIHCSKKSDQYCHCKFKIKLFDDKFLQYALSHLRCIPSRAPRVIVYGRRHQGHTLRSEMLHVVKWRSIIISIENVYGEYHWFF